MDKSVMLKTREEYVERVRMELLGPGSEISLPDSDHELISDAPNTRYSIGILYPQKCKRNADNDDAGRVEDTTVISKEGVFEEDGIDINKEEGFVSHTSTMGLSDEGDMEESVDVDNLDEEVGLATQNMPSSMGITFFVKGSADSLKCKVKFATYRRAMATDCRIPFDFDGVEDFEIPTELEAYIYIDRNEKSLRLTKGGLNRKEVRRLQERDLLGGDEHGVINNMYKLADQLAKGYVREPHEAMVEIKWGEKDYTDDNKELDGTVLKLTSLRRKINDDRYALTVMLVNAAEEERTKADLCIYQPTIIVSGEDNSFDFLEYSAGIDFDALNDEDKNLELQYHNKKVYSTGLGVSADWTLTEKGVSEIRSEYFPQVEVPGMDFKLKDDSGVEERTLSMKYLSDLDITDKNKKTNDLLTIVRAYNEWIEKIRDKASEVEFKLKDIAEANVKGCKKAAERMKKGIDILNADDNAWNAFSLANRAMYIQRVHLKLQSKMSDRERYPYDDELCDLLDKIDYRNADEFIEDKYSWRPFQLAFLLMSIESIVDENSDDRNLVDLIWFPTGGGKTEAYLGLTAFTIFYRRMAYENNCGGTTVIMRYTLRLLAAQQFTRAATLICACEYIRKDAISKKPVYGKYPLGNERITIGLWIGGDHTPNKNDKAKKELDFLLRASVEELDYMKDSHNKFQVLKCPWCGTKLVQDRNEKKKVGTFGYRMRGKCHFEIFCPQESCFYNSEGSLPVQIVDEELYDNPPTLLFGTVDKFAMLPWNSKIGAFFAVNSDNRTPELIIQDELHLISGPLGTMVGLYEAAIDALCKHKGEVTKIIASTATIRRAKEQCAALYDREVNQFPHPGIDAEDSFFARESVIDYSVGSYGRKYIGLFPSGKTKAMMEIRSIAAMMQKINEMKLEDEVKDKYWTLTVYFNSLRDLGKCSTLVDDDVKDFIKRMAYRLGNATDGRVITNADELTSRVSTTQLNQTLDKLEKLTYSKENIERKHYASNVLLATNMISVGIDVARLNVMLLVGQPKLTSEYIQASSRIGREYPGVAFIMYDGSKSRDRSHYEQFKGYHESFYRYVEPTGVTPFSKPARERALHAIVIALLRHLNVELNGEGDAAAFSREKYKAEIEKIKKYIVDRSNRITKRINPLMETEGEEVASEIDKLLEDWESKAEPFADGKFFYGEKFMIKHPEEDQGRLLKVYNTDKYSAAFDTMTSMRNVDVSVAGSVLIWEDEK